MKAISTRYHGATNTRASRYSASDLDGNRVTVSTEYGVDAEGNHDRVAIALCLKMGWKGPLMRGSTKTGNVYVFDEDHNRVRFDLEPAV